MWKVYKRTCPNGRVYIGITSRTLEERMSNGYQNNRAFALDIIKYGRENIISEVLEEYSDYDTAIERERYYISQYSDICYNTVGNRNNYRRRVCTVSSAQSNVHSHPTTKVIAHYKEHIVPLADKPKNLHICPIDVYDLNGNHLRTFKSAKDAATELQVNHGDIISCCIGKKPNGQPRYQAKGFVFRYAVDKLDQYQSPPVRCRKVHQYTLNGEYIRTFDSLKDAWLATGATIGAIGKVCKGLYKSSGGFIWQYADNEKEVG